MRIDQAIGEVCEGHVDVLSLCRGETCSPADVIVFLRAIERLPKEFWVTPQGALGDRSPIHVFISKKFPRELKLSWLNDPLFEDRGRALLIILKLMQAIKDYWHMPELNDFESLFLQPVYLVERVFRHLLAFDYVLFSQRSILIESSNERIFFELFDNVRLPLIILTVSSDQLRSIWDMTNARFQEKLIAKLADELAELPDLFWVIAITDSPRVSPRTLFQHLVYDKITSTSAPEQAILLRVLQCATNKTALIQRINTVHESYRVWIEKLHGARGPHNFNYQQLFSLKSSVSYLEQNPKILLGLFDTEELRQLCCDFLKTRSKRYKGNSLGTLIEIFEEANKVEPLYTRLSSVGSPLLMAARNAPNGRNQPNVSSGSGSDTETDEEWQALKRQRV